MKGIFTLAIILIVSAIFVCGQSDSWNNLTPLHSTRADVEKLLGKPKPEKSSCCRYETPEGNVSVDYSVSRCKEGWNVPKDTVLNLSVSPNSYIGKSFVDLKLDKSKFSLTTDDAFYGTWTNAEQGLQYYFSNVSKELISVNHIPKKSDNNLRCNGFPPFAPEAQYFTMERFPFQNKDLSKAENANRIYGLLDNFISNITDEDNQKGYVLIYFDKKLSLKEYEARISKIKEFIFKRRKTAAGKMTFIEGGLREDAEIEFYILPKDRKPPAPNPTLPSPQLKKQSLH